ncbi:MAG: hypothetical protein M3Z32_03630 [Acidobacteriota bacterium]|nr:hypothetical protein [Acidobacteriota bacterium]
MSASAVQILANRKNSALSTGPRTPAGKQRVSLNAVRHGLTSQVVVLAHEDMEAYQALVQDTVKLWAPTGIHEQRLVQRLVDTDWRLHRCPSLEHGLFAADPGVDPVSAGPAQDDPALQATLNAAQVLRADYKVLESIGRHETRLSRLYQSTLKELREVQQERQMQELAAMNRAANLLKTSKMKGEPYDPAADGFVLKTDQIESWVARDQRQRDSSLACSVRFNLAQFQRISSNEERRW